MKNSPYLNQSKGLIYVYEYDIDDLNEFTLGLQENYKLKSVEKATFIKPRSEHTSAFLITFDQETVPDSIYIPGERSDTKVYPFFSKTQTVQKLSTLWTHSLAVQQSTGLRQLQPT